MTQTAPDVHTAPDRSAADPTRTVLTAALVVGPVLSLAADTTYALRGWDSPTAGVVHVLGAIAYAAVVLRVAAWLPGTRLAAALLVTALAGMAGNVAYGFEAIHASLGDVALVDQAGAANLIKPLGLFFPLSLALVAVALWRLGRRWEPVLLVLAVVAWPVAHIGDVAVVAVPVNVALVVLFGSLVLRRPGRD
ncbi:hypothetical protein [uncultured Nocardioides sp.]|uniref:hypothetical protein n=1 Tax=uncultured Nocardioides sp. TaxID=198441 RepID=UPI002607B61F|nr:hypothetical protein [uncultured Nocardioides sp.]